MNVYREIEARLRLAAENQRIAYKMARDAAAAETPVLASAVTIAEATLHEWRVRHPNKDAGGGAGAPSRG